jgi:hypothetical protein
VFTACGHDFLARGVFLLVFTTILVLTVPGSLRAATVNLRAGTPVRLKLRYLLTTENVTKGDKIQFVVAEDVVAADQVVIAKGAPASGLVTRIKGAGNKKAKDASVAFRLMTVQAVDKQEINLRIVLQKSKKAAPTDYEAEERSIIPGLSERMVGAEEGREYTVYADMDVRVKVPDPPPPPPPPPKEPVVETAPPEPTLVNFNSEPVDAVIMIDGNPVGHTPATLTLAPGRHLIELKLANYRSWMRSMMVTPGSHPSIRATLEKE